MLIELTAGATYKLRCTECTLEYGGTRFRSRAALVDAWDNAPKKTIGKTKAKPVVKIDRNGNVIERYRSFSEAAKKNPMSKTSIKNRTSGKVKHEFAGCDYSFRLSDEKKNEGR